MSQLTFQCGNVAFNNALRKGDNATMLQLMSQLMSQCDNVHDYIVINYVAL